MFSGRDSQARPGTFESVLGKGIELKGNLKSKGSIRVDGSAEGSIISEADIMIGENAVINASLQGQNITIAGQVEGNVTCSGRLELLPAARLKGDIAAAALVISEGAVFTGTSQMAEPQPRAVSPTKQKDRTT